MILPVFSMLQQQDFEIGWQFSQEAQVVGVYNQVLVGLRWSKRRNSVSSSNEMKGIVKTTPLCLVPFALAKLWISVYYPGFNCTEVLEYRMIFFLVWGLRRAAPWTVCGVSRQWLKAGCCGWLERTSGFSVDPEEQLPETDCCPNKQHWALCTSQYSTRSSELSG